MKRFSAIGKARFKSPDAHKRFFEWCIDNFASFGADVRNYVNTLDKETPNKVYAVYGDQFGSNMFPNKPENFIGRIQEVLGYLEPRNLAFELLLQTEQYCIIGYGSERNAWIVPTEHLELTFTPDYSDIDVKQFRQAALSKTGISEEAGLIPVGNLPAASVAQARDILDSTEKDIEKTLAEMEDIKNGNAGELADLQKELDRLMQELKTKQKAMLAEMQSKMDELEIKKAEMERTIMVLECYPPHSRDFSRELGGSCKIRLHMV